MTCNDEIARAFLNEYRACVSYEKIVKQKKRQMDEFMEIQMAKEIRSPKLDGMPRGGNVNHDERLAVLATRHSEMEAEIESYQSRIDTLKETLRYIPTGTQKALKAIYKDKTSTIEGYAASHGTSSRKLRGRIQSDIVNSRLKGYQYDIIW